MQKIILVLIIVMNMLSLNSHAISAKSAILIDGESGRVLYEHNSYEKLPMASTTKIMTGLLACESGKLNETVKVSPFASGTEGSSLWLKVGEKLKLQDLTYGLMLKSGNDAAVAIAEYLGGSIDAFALLMNKRARAIGAVNTSFKNPHGLDSDGHYTTAYDLALIAKEAMQNEKFREIVSTKTYSIPMEGEKWDRALKNHNKLLWKYDGCNGVKTGFTKKCGRCLVSSAEKDGQKLICVTLNAPDDWDDHTFLLDYGYENYKAYKVAEKGAKVCDFLFDEKNNRKVPLVAENDCVISIKNGEKITVEKEFEKLIAPIKKSTYAGKLEVLCDGKIIHTVNLVTGKDIKRLSWKDKVKNLIK